MTQYKRLKVMHKEVLNLEICRIDVYTFGYEATTCTLYIAKIIITVTIQILSVEHTQWQWKTFQIGGGQQFVYLCKHAGSWGMLPQENFAN